MDQIGNKKLDLLSTFRPDFNGPDHNLPIYSQGCNPTYSQGCVDSQQYIDFADFQNINSQVEVKSLVNTVRQRKGSRGRRRNLNQLINESYKYSKKKRQHTAHFQLNSKSNKDQLIQTQNVGKQFENRQRKKVLRAIERINLSRESKVIIPGQFKPQSLIKTAMERAISTESQRQSEASSAKSMSTKSRVNLDPENNIDPQDPYKHIRITQNYQDQDIVCDVCLEGEFYEDDVIILCDLCNVAVHQHCYGSELTVGIPQTQWFCQRCTELRKDFTKKCTAIKCFLCPDIDGIIKQVKADLWAHVTCVNWIPEMWFKDMQKEQVDGVIQKQRFTLTCNRCHRRKGACIQCDFKNCTRSYHVKCWIRAGNIKNWNDMQLDLGSPDPNSDTPLFCHKHQESGTSLFRQKGIGSLKSNRKKAYDQSLIPMNEFNPAMVQPATKNKQSPYKSTLKSLSAFNASQGISFEQFCSFMQKLKPTEQQVITDFQRSNSQQPQSQPDKIQFLQQPALGQDEDYQHQQQEGMQFYSQAIPGIQKQQF